MWIFEIPMWAWLCSIYNVEGILDSKCVDNCKCCKNENCELGIFNWPNVCQEGCIDGHRGARCYDLCTHNCTTCDGHIDRCQKCYDGFYLGPNTDCTSECPASCKTCTSQYLCTACKEGYYNKEGSSTCAHSLCPRNCKCSDNVCVYCKEGFFDIATSCSKECPPNCMTCSSMNSCSVCKNDYYNGHEFDNNLKQELNNCTHKCRDTCTQCKSYDSCTQCIKGKYGQKCQDDCSVGCIDRTCHVGSGFCTCSSYFIGDNCSECASGKYGTYCNKPCPVYCNNSACDKSWGNCSNGCITNTIIGEKCSMCTAGMHGALCDDNCPPNCKDKICDRNNGECSEGCAGNFDDKTCKICKGGKYGTICEQDCPPRCADSLCEKDTGSCFSCTGNFDGDKCNVCKRGFYGLNCNVTCSIHCVNKSCAVDNGACEYGCTNEYSGDKCCVPGDNCTECASNTECNKCRSGYFGTLCNEKCSRNCLDSCDFITGVCSDCKINRFGPFCNRVCSQNCNVSHCKDKSVCLSSNGTCAFGCKDGSFGLTCNKTCSSLCTDNVCKQEKGLCVKGCTDSYDDPVCALTLESYACDGILTAMSYMCFMCESTTPMSCKQGQFCENSGFDEQQDESGHDSTRTIIAVLATISAVSTTALCVLMAKNILEKVRSRDRHAKGSSLQIHFDNSLVGGQHSQNEDVTVVSDRDNIAYETLEVNQEPEHTYEAANPNATESMASGGKIEYMNLQL